ncbi:MAG: terminase [Mycobacteriaceae bacterium]|nr:terminase [Mycobacteriaceae bacterium]
MMVHPLVFVPQAVVDAGRRALVPLDAWRRAGHLLVTDGNVVDQDAIVQAILAFGQQYRITEIAFDPWNATQLALRFKAEGLAVVEVRQGPKTLSEPTQALAALVVDGKLQHGGHPVLRWMADNFTVRTDPNANVAPDKARASEKIDAIVALIMALSRRGKSQQQQYQMLVLGGRR